MTLRQIIGWWRQDVVDWWRARRPTPVNDQARTLAGRMCAFSRDGGLMGYPSYTVYARRGGFVIGRIEYRSQWNYHAFYPTKDGVSTPLNQEIIAEIFAMLKELRTQ